MFNVRGERLKSDLKRGLALVFVKKNFNQVLFTDIYLSRDLKYAKIELDLIFGDIDEFIVRLNSNPLHSEVVKNLRQFVNFRNFPQIVFAKDSHKERIARSEELMKKF